MLSHHWNRFLFRGSDFTTQTSLFLISFTMATSLPSKTVASTVASIFVPEVTLQVSDWGVPTAGTPVAAAYNVVAPMTDAEDITMAIQSSVSQTTRPILIQPRRVGQPMTAASYANQYVLGVDNRADASLRALSAPREGRPVGGSSLQRRLSFRRRRDRSIVKRPSSTGLVAARGSWTCPWPTRS